METSKNSGVPQREYLLNHTNETNAFINENYPYGRLRTERRVWIETDPKGKKGDRFVTQTKNPKNGRWNKPKKSTYQSLGFLFLDEKKHIHWTAVNIYSDKKKIEYIAQAVGGVDKLNEGQRIMYNSLMGISHATYDDLGNKEKPFRIRWEKHQNEVCELIITFNRTDGVQVKEIFEAMKTANQDKLKQVYAHKYGVVRIKARGGVYLGTIEEESYRDYLASDTSTYQDETIAK